MNLPALKGGVSLSKSRRVKRRLLGKIPAMMAVINVRLDNISSYITNTAKKLSRTPKMAFTKMPAQPRMLAEKLVGAAAFKQLKRFGNAQRRWQIDKQMDVIRFNLELKYLHIMRFRNLTQKLLTMFTNNRKLKRVLRILWLPHEVERVLSNTVAMVVKSFHHFFVSPRVFCRAHTTQTGIFECASCAAHSFIVNRVEKYGGGSKISDTNCRNSSVD